MFIAYINFAILLLISGIHVYWGLGGKWGLQASLPERDNAMVFQPGRIATLVVAVIFAGMGVFYLYKAGQFPALNALIPDWLSHYGLWLLAGVFLLRALGDFMYVGFFKRIRGTRFATLDTRFYSPLCLFLCITTIVFVLSLPNG